MITLITTWDKLVEKIVFKMCWRAYDLDMLIIKKMNFLRIFHSEEISPYILSFNLKASGKVRYTKEEGEPALYPVDRPLF